MKRGSTVVRLLLIVALVGALAATATGCYATPLRTEELEDAMYLNGHPYVGFVLYYTTAYAGGESTDLPDPASSDYYINRVRLALPDEPVYTEDAVLYVSPDYTFAVDPENDIFWISSSAPNDTYTLNIGNRDAFPAGEYGVIEYTRRSTSLAVSASTNVMIIGEDHYSITGEIKKPAGKLLGGAVDINLLDPNDDIAATGVAINGAYELVANADDLVPNTVYRVVIDAESLAEDEARYVAPAKPIEVAYRYDLKLDTLPGLKYGGSGKVISGRIVDSEGNGVGGCQVKFLEQIVPTHTNGTFAVVSDITAGGTQPVLVVAADGDGALYDAMPYGQIEIAAQPFGELTAIKSAVHTARPVDLGLTAMADINGDGELEDVTDETTYTLSGVKINDYIVEAIEDESSLYGLEGSVFDGEHFTRLVLKGTGYPISDLYDPFGGEGVSAQQIGPDEIPCLLTFAEKGTLTIDANYNGCYIGSVAVDIKDPADVNITFMDELDLAEAPQPSVNDGPFYLQGALFDKAGESLGHFHWEVSGDCFDLETKKGEGYDGSFYIGPIYPLTGGKVTLKVTAYDDEDKALGEANAVIDVDGYTFSVNPTEVTVNQKSDITVVVKDIDGNVVNNAIVGIDNRNSDTAVTVSAMEENISEGTYVLKNVCFDSVDTARIEVWTITGKLMAVGNVKVNGEPVYSLEILTSKVTAGVAADIEVKVTKDGESVADIGDDEFFVDGVNTYDVGYDPVNEVYTINGAVVETTDDDVFVEVKTDFATKVGKAKIEAPIPVVVVTPDTITNLYTQTVKVTITDPLTGNPLKATLDVAAPDLYFSVKGDVDAEVTDYALGEDETYRLAGKAMGNGLAAYEFKLTAVPSDTDGNDEIKPEVKIVGIHTEDGDLEVEIPVALGDPVLALDNAKLIMGFANPVQITLKDALGNALPDYAVYYGGSQIGVTDANGGLLYSVVPAATGSVTFKGATDAVHDDAAQYVVARASVAEDVTGPVINVTLPESVTTDVLVITGTVTDDSRVAALYLNNKPVAIIPGRSTTFMYEVQLEMGENVIRIIALDGNGNGSEFVGKITRAVTPAAPAAD